MKTKSRNHPPWPQVRLQIGGGLALNLPLHWQFEGAIQRFRDEALALIATSGVTDAQCAKIVRIWAQDDPARFARYNLVEHYLQQGDEAVLAKLSMSADSFRLISAVLMLAILPRLDECREVSDPISYGYWIAWAFRFGANMRGAVPLARGHRLQQKNKRNAETRGRELRRQGANTRRAVQAVLQKLGETAPPQRVTAELRRALGDKAPQIARVRQLLRELREAKKDRNEPR